MPDRTEGLTLATSLSFYCVEAGAGTPTAVEAKCEDTSIKEAVKFVQSLGKCTDKCTKSAQKGDIAYSACAPANGAAGTGVCLNGTNDGTSCSVDGDCTGGGFAPVSRAIPRHKSATRRRR